MLRKLLCLIVAVVLSLNLHAQNLPILKAIGGGSNISIFPDTIYSNQVYPLFIAVLNLSPTFTYTNGPANPLHIVAESDSIFGSFTLFTDSSSFVLPPGDSIVFQTATVFPSGAFKLGNNVVVVWPAQTSGLIDFVADTTINNTFYAGTSSIREYGYQNLLIYPNPFTQSVVIDNVFEQRIQFYVYDLSGRIVYQNLLDNKALDLSFLNNGIYFLELRNENKIMSRSKIIKL